MTCDPIIVIGPTVSIATNWAKAHIKAHERMPLTVESLNRLIGIRERCIVILPDVVLPVDKMYVLTRNTVIDLRFKENVE